MKKIEIFGWQTDQRFDDWSEKFEQVYNYDGEALYQSKETFHHNEDDDFDFDYKYCVKFVDFSYYESEGIGYELHLVVMPNSIHKSHIDKLCKDNGITPNDIGIRDSIDEVSAMVKFGGGMCNEWGEIDGILLRIAHVFECMDRMRGFYIDKLWNRIGSTGWDTLEYATKGTDLFKPAFDRYNKEKEEAV